MRHKRVGVVRCHPFDARPEILAHPRHKPANEGSEIIIFCPVVCSHDEPKMMSVTRAPFYKSAGVRVIFIG